MDRKQVLCTCPKFNEHTFIDNTGIRCCGKYVHPSTRQRHWTRITQPSQKQMKNKIIQLPADEFPTLMSAGTSLYKNRSTEKLPDLDESDEINYHPTNTNQCN
ncbi:hypothetical protein O181_124450 [Austropuccinia psidii MF-1]|uniref:Uncharacterized protein n=1 Tax=Austropuccinia psidii MF-1 TaxID=1389203 RepID=A0A9Q3Q566_9BASI|nr:hypothetical protein [Austropuccinia psidii MF-1]